MVANEFCISSLLCLRFAVCTVRQRNSLSVGARENSSSQSLAAHPCIRMKLRRRNNKILMRKNIFTCDIFLNYLSPEKLYSFSINLSLHNSKCFRNCSTALKSLVAFYQILTHLSTCLSIAFIYLSKINISKRQKWNLAKARKFHKVILITRKFEYFSLLNELNINKYVIASSSFNPLELRLLAYFHQCN